MNRPPHILLGLVFATAATLVFWGASAAEKDTQRLEAVGGQAADREASIADLAAQLPSIPAKEAAAALAEFQLHEQFRIELVAAEPLIQDPVAVDFDENGRMFVVELPGYNAYATDDQQLGGRVRVLEDTDSDGRFDTSDVFVQDLDYPTAIACWDGGLFIGAAPDLLYVKDTDGDGRADTRQVVFTGFGRDDAGEAHLNSIRWGFDHRFHLSTSLSGGNVIPAGRPASEAVSVRGRGFIFDPRAPERFELTSGGGQHGLSLDDWGGKFVCSNSVPAQFLMYDDRYLARNSSVEAPAPAVDIAPEGKFTKLYRISPSEPWRALRTRLRSEGRFRGSDEGGKAFGFFTGASGITIYRGDAWPDEYRGNLLVGDVANNLVYRANVVWNGIVPVAHRADRGREFLASRDIWFRPVQFANAPDGNLYVIDFYRGLVEGAAFLPPEFLRFLDPTQGTNRGRIYRIRHVDDRPRSSTKLKDATTSELVSLLEHQNGWHRDTASRLLYERQDPHAAGPLRDLVARSRLPVGRMTALYALAGLGALDERTLLSRLEDPAPMVRVHALRLCEEHAATSASIASKMCAMAADADIRVRYQLAYSLGAFGGAARNQALARIISTDGNEPWIRLAALSSLAEEPQQVFEILSHSESYRRARHGQQFLANLAKQIGQLNRRDEVAAVLRVLNQLPDDEEPLAIELLQALLDRKSGGRARQTLLIVPGKSTQLFRRLLDTARKTAVDPSAAIEQRLAAIGQLKLAPFDHVQALLRRLLDVQQPSAVQAATLKTLAEFQAAGAAELVLEAWPGMSPALRAQAAETLMARPAWIAELLDRIDQGYVGRAELDPARVELLKKHPDRQIAERVSDMFSGSGLPTRTDVIQRYQSSLELAGDRTRGKEVFRQVCSACHQLEGVGTEVGADLKGIRQRGLPAVMLNVLDPNREVKPQFLTYVLELQDGRVLTGMIEVETANNLRLRRPDGSQVDVQRNQIERLRSTGVSFMPEGLEKQVDLQAMADLLRYLDSLP